MDCFVILTGKEQPDVSVNVSISCELRAHSSCIKKESFLPVASQLHVDYVAALIDRET